MPKLFAAFFTFVLYSFLASAEPTTTLSSTSQIQAGQDTGTKLPTDFDLLDAYIQTQLNDAGIPGAVVVVVSRDKVLHIRGFGISSPDGKLPTSKTLFMLGSTSKSFTALAVMQLVEARKIQLDIPVRKYIPWFQVGDTDMSGRITVRQLLNQNSGFSTLDGRNNFADSDSPEIALEKIVRSLQNVKLTSLPGTHWEYSNINYAILGYLIQEVSGEPYDQYMDHHVFGPLGMHDSKASDQQINKNLMATGYRYWFGKAIPAYGLPYPTSMAPAGYLFTNADDMGRYLMAQLNGGVAGGVSVVSSEGIDTLHRSGVPAFGKNRYAMGWFFNSANPNFFDHNGGLPNFFSQMAIDTKDGWGVALLVNANNMLSGPDVIAIGPQVENILRGRKPTEIKKAPFFVPALIELTGLLIVQLLITFWMVRRTDRWATNPENSPKSKAGWIMNATFPAVIGLILATFLTIVIPKVNGGNLSGLVLFAPDAGLLLLANICVSLSGGIVCTYFVAKHYFVKDIKT